MELEIRVDRAAYRRYRRGMLAFLWAVILFLPAVALIAAVSARLLGREAAGQHFGPLLLAGFAALMALPLYGTRDQFVYRCPRCGRRPERVVPQGVTEPNICFHCAECRVVWDLGWGQGPPA
jgi:hypothetical protein